MKTQTQNLKVKEPMMNKIGERERRIRAKVAKGDKFAARVLRLFKNGELSITVAYDFVFMSCEDLDAKYAYHPELAETEWTSRDLEKECERFKKEAESDPIVKGGLRDVLRMPDEAPVAAPKDSRKRCRGCDIYEVAVGVHVALCAQLCPAFVASLEAPEGSEGLPDVVCANCKTMDVVLKIIEDKCIQRECSNYEEH